jgi:thiol:disulfide interchange protein DsbD
VTERLDEWGYALKQLLESQLQGGSFGAVFVAYLAGVLTSLTPCVYPMIPVVITFMGGAARGSRGRAFTLSLVYVGGMALVYAALGVLSATAGWTFGAAWRNPWVYGSVAVVIITLGLAMLDVFTVPIPGFAGSMQSTGARRGGVAGALIMGVASGFIAAPCSAPVLGFLLIWIARSGDLARGGLLMLAFSLGLGTLLLILGVSSGLLASLPRAGGWMRTVKLLFGIGMLCVGGYFAYQAVMMWVEGRAA